MACNVFGTPITDEFIREMPEYLSYDIEITQKQKARVALLKKNADGKDVKARKFVEGLKERLGHEEKNVAMCLIYNATGGPVTFVKHHTWYGHLAESPVPPRIENGQWGAFVTVRYQEAPTNFSFCCARFKRDKVYWGQDYKCRSSVVYSGKNSHGAKRHWLLSWSINRKSINQVYTEIGVVGEFEEEEKFQSVDEKLSSNVIHHSAEREKGFMFGMIGNETSAVVECIMTLPDVWFPN